MKSCFPLMLLLLLAGCGGGPKPVERPVGTGIGYAAPEFELPRVGEGGSLSLAALRGKVVLISFWASWCGPCKVEMRALDAAWAGAGDDVVFVGVSVDDAQSDAEAYLRRHPVRYPVVWDAGGRMGALWQAFSIPMTVLVDRQGVVRDKHVGFDPRTFSQTLGAIDALAKEGQ